MPQIEIFIFFWKPINCTSKIFILNVAITIKIADRLNAHKLHNVRGFRIIYRLFKLGN